MLKLTQQTLPSATPRCLSRSDLHSRVSGGSGTELLLPVKSACCPGAQRKLLELFLKLLLKVLHALLNRIDGGLQRSHMVCISLQLSPWNRAHEFRLAPLKLRHERYLWEPSFKDPRRSLNCATPNPALPHCQQVPVAEVSAPPLPGSSFDLVICCLSFRTSQLLSVPLLVLLLVQAW